MSNAPASPDNVLEKIYEKPEDSFSEIKNLLLSEDPLEAGRLFLFADEVRRKSVGDGVLLRGIIEFSNYCSNSCFYCGLNNRNIGLKRYRMTADEILRSVNCLAKTGIKTVVLQSGEDDKLDPFWFADIIKDIKKKSDIAVTISVGEKDKSEYRLWRDAGADRYLLKIETSDSGVYASAHNGRLLESRLKCLDELIDMGYQTGSGLLIGLKGQTVDSIARDIIFLGRKKIDMIGIGPFIPHPDTIFADNAAGNIQLTLKTIALIRIVTRNAHMPATTAIGSSGWDHRIEALKAGANVLMPNFTPVHYRKLYEIYPGKVCVDEEFKSCVSCMHDKAESAGRFIDYSVGHTLKRNHAFN